MVDERLADFSSRHSNFGGVVEILKAASIPYFNLHPIPVGLHPALAAKVRIIWDLYSGLGFIFGSGIYIQVCELYSGLGIVSGSGICFRVQRLGIYIRIWDLSGSGCG